MARTKTFYLLHRVFLALFLVMAVGMSGANPFKRGVRNSVGNTVANSELDLGSRVWVKRPDGSVSCETTEQGHAENHKEEKETVAALLKKAGIHVFETKKMNDGQMRAAVCGIATGNEDAFLITEKDLAKAKELGFSPASK